MDWSVAADKQRHIRWSAALGSKAAFWRPAILGGRIFIGTNNQAPRDPDVIGDKGVLM